MKKRLHKKLRLREFQEMGFQVNFDFINYSLRDGDWQFFDKIVPFAEENGLYTGGGLNSFYVTAAPRHSVSEAQRQLLATWLTQQHEVANLVVSPLSDAWYVKEDEWDDKLTDEMLGRLANLARV